MSLTGGIVKGAQIGSDLVMNAFEQDWKDLAAGQSPIYTAVVSVSMLIAIFLVSFWSLGWYRQISDEGFSQNVVSEMVFPLLVILMLSNNGAMLANTSLALRNVTVNLNSSILSITRNGITLKDAIRSVNTDQTFIAAAQTEIAKCDTLPTSETDAQGNKTNPRQKCIDEKIYEAQKQAQATKKDKGIFGINVTWNPLDMGGQIINKVVQGTIFAILMGLSAGFQYILQMSFLLTVYVAPIFLVLSFLPFGAKPIYAWLSGWLGLTLVLISYSITVGIIAGSIVNQPSSSLLLMQLLQAIFSPALAVAIGTGTGMSVFKAFTSGINFSISALATVIR
ncbi:hypothetical protein [Anabaena sp. UHCC 0399]|uniref:hypothetical protein n=1 Tax=Anabaena sp. UHCC 0399 TaxID=3110238 RepID=UPI002B201345|nr:hypothetical protein [Anabaena sp. UHCC 0399]MEA5566636.1 hypothetical protein [Anabaena sp. UHCC 0399]